MGNTAFKQVRQEMKQMSPSDLVRVWVVFTNLIPDTALTAEQSALVDSIGSMDERWRIKTTRMFSQYLMRQVMRSIEPQE